MTTQADKLVFTDTHEWLNPGQDEMTVGITDHAQALLGDMVYVELPDVGRQVEAGEEVAVVESVKAASDVYSPIKGIVTAVNEALSSNPALVNTEPFGTGWLFKIKPACADDAGLLMTKEQYEKTLGKEH